MSLLLACRSASSAAPSPPPSGSSALVPALAPRAADAVPLQVATVTDMKESERGGVAVVLLHGWGAAGDDLVPLARRVARPRSRFFMPAGPLTRGPSGRAWWHL